MFVVRNTFTAKPGMAGKLAAQMKETGTLMKLSNLRVMTDFASGFNTVVMEHEAKSLADLEASFKEYGSNAEVKEKMKGYTDLWTEGRREIFQLV